MNSFEELGFSKFHNKTDNEYITYAAPYFEHKELMGKIESLISHGYIDKNEYTRYENIIGKNLNFSKDAASSDNERKWLSVIPTPNLNGYHWTSLYDEYTFNEMWIREYPDLEEGLINSDNIGGTRESLDLKYMRFIPLEAMAAAAASFEYGAKKYKSRNWEKGLPWQQMIDSTRRHLDDFERGEELDESGLAQVDMLMASCMMLVASVLRGIGEDDRVKLIDDKAWSGKDCSRYITNQVNKGKYDGKRTY